MPLLTPFGLFQPFRGALFATHLFFVAGLNLSDPRNLALFIAAVT